MRVTLTWLGHACFMAETAGRAVVLDPYTGVKGYAELPALRADAVLCSHEHGDHSFRSAVTLTGAQDGGPFAVTVLPCFHDDRQGALRGQNRIHLLETSGGLRLAHFGDLGHIPDAQTLDALRGCHAVMVPVGGHYTIDAPTAKALKDALAPRVFIPMHYRQGALGFDVLAKLDDFLALCGDVRRYAGNAIEIDADTPAQTAVLTYQ